MRDDPTRFVGSIPDYYDKGLGPVIFAEPADVAARRVASLEPSRVLETAAGTGIVTRRMRDALPPAADIVATDLNAAMLEVCGRKFRPDESVAFQAADATALPFADGAFDAVVCQFGVMFFPEKDRAYREARRVLAAGGHYVFSVWDALEHNPFGRIVSDALRDAFDADPPPFLDAPFGYAAIDPIKASLLANGFDGSSRRLGAEAGADRRFRRLRDRPRSRQPARRPDPRARRRSRKAGARGRAIAARRIRRGQKRAASIHPVRRLARVSVTRSHASSAPEKFARGGNAVRSTGRARSAAPCYAASNSGEGNRLAMSMTPMRRPSMAMTPRRKSLAVSAAMSGVGWICSSPAVKISETPSTSRPAT